VKIKIDMLHRNAAVVVGEHAWWERWLLRRRDFLRVAVLRGRDWCFDDTGARVDGNAAERTPIADAIRREMHRFDVAQRHLDAIERMPTTRWDNPRLN
jgi:hypothetical protein